MMNSYLDTCQLAGRHMVYKRLVSALSNLVPQSCPVCGDRCFYPELLCPACLEDLPQTETSCQQCGVKLSMDSVCGNCQADPPLFSQTFSAFAYGSPIDHLIQQFKYANRLDLGRVLGIAMAKQLGPKLKYLPDLLVPVPLHRSKLRQRGYNQALELAKWLSKQLGVAVDTVSTSRQRKTLAQTGLPYKERRHNIRNAFSMVAEKLAGKHIALVDDVMTTGSTANELTRILLKSDVKRVDVWVLARVQPPNEDVFYANE